MWLTGMGVNLTLLTYLCPSTRWEHGPSIKALHRILRCAMVAISCQVYPIFLASDSTSRRQVFLGRPLFLFQNPSWFINKSAIVFTMDFSSIVYLCMHFNFQIPARNWLHRHNNRRSLVSRAPVAWSPATRGSH